MLLETRWLRTEFGKPENQNNEFKVAKMLHRADGNCTFSDYPLLVSLVELLESLFLLPAVEMILPQLNIILWVK